MGMKDLSRPFLLVGDPHYSSHEQRPLPSGAHLAPIWRNMRESHYRWKGYSRLRATCADCGPGPKRWAKCLKCLKYHPIYHSHPANSCSLASVSSTSTSRPPHMGCVPCVRVPDMVCTPARFDIPRQAHHATALKACRAQRAPSPIAKVDIDTMMRAWAVHLRKPASAYLIPRHPLPFPHKL